MAGNDVLLMPTALEDAKKKLLKLYERGKITEDRLAHSVKKILKAKYKVGLHDYTPIKQENIPSDLNSLQDDLVYEEAIENAITVVKNNFYLMGIKKLENKKIAYVKFGDAPNGPFIKELNKYAKVTQVNGKDIATLKKKLADYNLIIIGHHRSNESPWKPYTFFKERTLLVRGNREGEEFKFDSVGFCQSVCFVGCNLLQLYRWRCGCLSK